MVDTHHVLDEMTLVTLDASDMSAFIVTNDLVDLKNMKSLISILNESKKDNYKMILNNSRDTGRDYISLFDVRNIIKNNIDFTISRNFYIKNIDKYVLKGEILTLNKFIKKTKLPLIIGEFGVVDRITVDERVEYLKYYLMLYFHH